MRIAPIFLLLFSCPLRAAPLQISPQSVVDRVLGHGRDAKVAALQEDKAVAGVHSAMAVYDWKLAGSWSKEDNRSVTLSGLSNLEDDTTIWKTSLSKKLPTGTTVG
ncbi:MAG: hypothetical protein HUU37_07265, partial [Bdellovibrionales bacterium]|nr:hypothetical protein [Bdellovibrionales bacterium]